jgi:hypothetical protein
MQTAPPFMIDLTLSADVPYKCPLNSPCSMNFPASMSPSILSRDINRYSLPGTSPVRIGLVVSVEHESNLLYYKSGT